MLIFDFITPDEVDALPDDDPQLAFVTFVRTAQTRLGERVRSLNGNDESEWREIQEARYGFQNVVVAAAKKYGIEPFASLAVPRLKKFDEDTHRQFRSDLDHYLTQLLLDNSSRAKRDSVLMSTELKSKIQSYVYHLRQVIENAPDLNSNKKNILLKRLVEFEAELEKPRLSLMAVGLIAIALVSAPGGVWQTYDVAAKLVTGILREVGDAKNADDATRRLPSAAAPMAITGPRPPQPDKESPFDGKRGDLDDEIPF